MTHDRVLTAADGDDDGKVNLTLKFALFAMAYRECQIHSFTRHRRRRVADLLAAAITRTCDGPTTFCAAASEPGATSAIGSTRLNLCSWGVTQHREGI
jgi:hypothetical protein